jgi:hypothetical protein
LARHGDGNIDEQKAVEKYLRVVPKKYTQIALSMEILLNLLTLSIEEVTGRLKAVDDHEEAPPVNPVSINGKLLFTEEQWLARQKEKKKRAHLRLRIYYIPALWNSIISLGRLNEAGSRVEIDQGVLRIWDSGGRLLTKVNHGCNRLYMLHMEVARSLCLAAR